MRQNLIKYIIVCFAAAISAFVLVQFPLYISGALLGFFVLLLLSRLNGWFFANVFLLLVILLLFSSDAYILDLAKGKNIYDMFKIWKFNIFEWWVLMLFFLFIVYRLSIIRQVRGPLLQVGPLKPLLFFVAGGLILGVFGTIRNRGELSFSQIRFYCEGILLYLIIINLDLKKGSSKAIFYSVIAAISAKSLYHLFLYVCGRGFIFGSLGRVTIGYGDILYNIVMVSLMLFSALIYVKNLPKPIYLLGITLVLINSAVIFLSLRRAISGIYLMGIAMILIFSNRTIKIRSMLLLAILLAILLGATTIAGNNALVNKILVRLDSINIFKHKEDTGSSIRSSTGHVSEFINGWQNVKDSIILGKGFGVKIQKLHGWQYNYNMLHNELFFYWIRMGIFGMLMFFTMYLIPIFYCLRRIRATNYEKGRWFYLAVMGLLTGTFMVSATVAPPSSLFISLAYMFFILLGFLMNPTFFKDW